MDRSYNPYTTEIIVKYAVLKNGRIGRLKGKVSKTKRAAVYARDNHACINCGAQKHLTIDHIIPLVKGGSNEISNLQTMCRDCNSRKGDTIGGKL